MSTNSKPANFLNPEDIVWTRIVEPRERYRILYLDRDGKQTERTIELQKIGHRGGAPYLGVQHDGTFKTFRSDRVLGVLEQLTTGHKPSIIAAITYRTQLPSFPAEAAGWVHRVPMTHSAHPLHRKFWTIDLSKYTCTCPEGRRRAAKGYKPGQVGFVCDHMAKAMLSSLPNPTPAEWSPALVDFLRDPTNTALSNLH